MSDPTRPNVPLPPLHVAEVDEAVIRQLFDDLLELALVVTISTKGAPTQRGSNTDALSLEDARDLLLSSQIQGLQLRYRHDGATWCDTLLHLGGVFRVVRIKEEDVLAGSGEEKP